MKRQLNILLVDDSADDRMLYNRLLLNDATTSWAILEAETSEEALAILQEWPVDAVLLDYSLPDGTGLKLLAAIKAIHPQAAVVMLTGQGNEAVAATAIKKGASDYLVKSNITDDRLENTLNQAVAYCTMQNQLLVQQESLKHYAKVLTHDLLGPIKNINELINITVDLIQKEKYEEIREFVPYMEKTTNKAIHLIESMTAYNRLYQKGFWKESVSMQKIMEEVMSNLQVLIIEKNARVTWEKNLPDVIYHKEQLIQLLQNLIVNGIKFCRHNHPEMQIHCDRKHDVWQFGITDNGIGIAAENQQKIFDMFTRLNSYDEFEGVGIGLAICKKIVNQHRGKIWCESNKDGGSTFFFTIPQFVESKVLDKKEISI